MWRIISVIYKTFLFFILFETRIFKIRTRQLSIFFEIILFLYRLSCGKHIPRTQFQNILYICNIILLEVFVKGLNQIEDLHTNRITRILTNDFPHYFAVVTRIRQEVHAIGPDGGTVSSTAVPLVQAVFPSNALTKKIRVGLQVKSAILIRIY